jgi:hypothetical protein
MRVTIRLILIGPLTIMVGLVIVLVKISHSGMLLLVKITL